jgi:hypothetical protein
LTPFFNNRIARSRRRCNAFKSRFIPCTRLHTRRLHYTSKTEKNVTYLYKDQ